ncbi:peptidoglycan-binding protein [Candidatus Kaiserbacteria bacterium]|nr:peptidoglycan-binding protein [Candidatus Kaiserbacteria bacterium]
MNLTFIHGARIAAVSFAAALAFFVVATVTNAQVVFTQSMDIGSRGAEVSALQTFLSTRTPHYPEGLITSYYGPLTAAAVQRFQCAEEIVCSGTAATTGFGRVGPITRAQLNLRASGIVTGGADVSAPFIAGVVVSTTTSNSATITFSTNEAARSQVYYAPGTLMLSEAGGIGLTPAVSGAPVMTDNAFRTSHAITITGLARSTTYSFTVHATDASGNLSVTWPMNFRTNP